MSFITAYREHPVHLEIQEMIRLVREKRTVENLTEEQKESLDFNEQLMVYAQYILENNLAQFVPVGILNNIQNSIVQMKPQILNAASNSSFFITMMDWLNKIPVKEGRGYVQATFNKMQEDFKSAHMDQLSNNEKAWNAFLSTEKEQADLWQKKRNEIEKEITKLNTEKDGLELKLKNLSDLISQEQTKITSKIDFIQNDYDKQKLELKKDFDNSQELNKTAFENLIDETKASSEKVQLYLENKKKDIEKLWGIVSTECVAGSSQNYADRAKNFAHFMTGLSLSIMIIALVVLCCVFWNAFDAKEINYLQLVAKILLTSTFFLPAWYLANIANKQRNREFQLRDFEIKVAGLEPFIESMKITNEKASSEHNKTDLKLELAKSIFMNDLDKKKVDDTSVVIPKDALEIIKTTIETYSKIKGNK